MAREKVWSPKLGPLAGLVLLAPGVALIGVMFVWPLVDIFRLGFSNGTSDIRFVLEPDSLVFSALVRTLWMAGIVTVLALLFGSFVAWEWRSATSKVKKAVIAAAVIFPFWSSVIVRNYALTAILQRRGVLNTFLVDHGIIDKPLEILYTPTAVIIGMLYIMVPYATLPMYAAFSAVDLELVRAARNLGASPFTAFRTVIVPLAAPGFFAAASLIYVLSMGFYITPLLLGGGAKPFVANTVSDLVFTQFQMPQAAALGAVLLVIAMVVLGVMAKLVGADRLRGTVG